MKKIDSTVPPMKICESALYALINFVGAQKAESGGLLFGKEDDYVIREFIPDIYAETTGSTYSINSDYLNPKIHEKWVKEALSVIGVGHAHPPGSPSPSNPDIKYFTDLLKNMPRKHFFTPIIFTVPDGGFSIHPYVFTGDQKFPVKTTWEVVPDDYAIPITQKNIPIQEETVASMVLATTLALKEKLIPLFSSADSLLLFFIKLLGVGVLTYFVFNLLPPFMILIIKLLTS